MNDSVRIDGLRHEQPAPEVHSFSRAESAGVKAPFESLGADETKAAFSELDALLTGLAATVVHTLDQMVPYLANMQSLLSQRGKDRKKVLRQAGLPTWTEYATGYANKLDCSLRTIQDHITELHRTGRSGPSRKPKNQQHCRDTNKRARPWHADARDSRALAEAQLAINDLIAAYEAGVELEPAYQSYKAVAVSPAKLNSILDVATGETPKVDVDAEVKRRLVPVVETAERYIRALEVVVHSEAVTITDEQRERLQKPMEEWRSILRYARGVQAERTSKGMSTEVKPAAMTEVT